MVQESAEHTLRSCSRAGLVFLWTLAARGRLPGSVLWGEFLWKLPRWQEECPFISFAKWVCWGVWKKPGCELNSVQRSGFLSGQGFKIGVDLEWQAGGTWAEISWPFLEMTLISRTIGCWVLRNNAVRLLFTWTFTYMNKASGSSFPNRLPNFIIFVTTLLSYNSHIVQFGHLNKGYNSVFFMYSENCAIATTVNCRRLLSPLEN